MKRLSNSRFLARTAMTLLAVFCFLGGARAVELTVNVSEITTTSALVRWSGNAESYDLRYVANPNYVFQGFVTNPGAMDNGADASWTQGSQSTWGPNVKYASGYMLADDFTVYTATTLHEIEVYGYQTGSTTTSTFTGLRVQIYDGNPAEGGTAIWGDMDTNIMTATSFTNCYRASNGETSAMTRPIMAITASGLDIYLEPGTYWLVYSLEGTGSSGPWGVPYAEPTVGSTGEGLQYTSSGWTALTDARSGTPYGCAMKLTFEDLESLDWTYVNHIEGGEYDFTNLSPETTYLVQVRANYSDEGPSKWISTTFTTLPTCMVPTNLAVSNIDKRSADLTWTSNGEEGTWQICINGDEDNLIEVTENPYTLTDLEPETTYTVKVRAFCDEDDQSAWSSPITFTTLPTCMVPTNLAVSNIDKRSADLAWTSNGEEGTWQICINGDEANLIEVTENPYTLTDLEPETTYTVKVRAYCDEDDQSAWSSPITFTTLVACPAPTDLTVNDITFNSAVVSWTADDDVELQYGENLLKYYDNGICTDGIGTGGSDVYWAIMLPPTMLNDQPLTKVLVYEATDYNAEPITIMVYSGGDDAPATLLYQEEVTTLHANAFHEITLAEPVTFDASANLWIVCKEYGTYPAQACINTGDANGRWISLDGEVWEDVADYGLNYTWMIRAGFGDTQWITVDNATSPQAITGLTPNTDYIVRVKHICGGIDGESAWATTLFTTQTVIVLADNGIDNATIIANNDGNTDNVVLKDRTLYKDGLWNTICLPFDVVLEGSPLEGAIAKTLTDASTSPSALYDMHIDLIFGDAVTTLEAGKPYIIRWDKAEGYDEADPDTRDIKEPEFTNVTINDATDNHTISMADGNVQFIGYYNAFDIDETNDDIYYMKAGDDGNTKLVSTGKGRTLMACRAYFKFSDTAANSKITLNFDDETTGITTTNATNYANGDDSWYSLDGRKLVQQPTRKGVYIQNGRAVVIK